MQLVVAHFEWIGDDEAEKIEENCNGIDENERLSWL